MKTAIILFIIAFFFKMLHMFIIKDMIASDKEALLSNDASYIAYCLTLAIDVVLSLIAFMIALFNL